ncbi:MAG: DUF2085 domain-containing protein [Anaerolineae bacterium]
MSTPGPLADRVPAPPDRLTRAVNGMVAWIARHWLLLFSVLLILYLAVPVAAPILMQSGHERSARLIYAFYRLLCHELPERSYFLFGPQPLYSLSELTAAGVLPGPSILERPLYLGDMQFGYKIALCQRDLAIYGSVLLGGWVFGLLRGRAGLPRLTIKTYLIFLAPIAVDGFTQLFGWRESNYLLRTATGALFGLASAWLAYPNIQDAMADALQSLDAVAS